MSAAKVDPEAITPDRREIRLSEIARELAELLEMGRRDDESWDLEFWSLPITPPKPMIQYTVRVTGSRGNSWNVMRRVDPAFVNDAREPFSYLRKEVERAYSMLRNRQ